MALKPCAPDADARHMWAIPPNPADPRAV